MIMSYIHHIPEGIAIALLGILAMNCLSIPSLIIATKKVRRAGDSSIWEASSVPAIALSKAAKPTRNLFLAYALIYPAYLNYPNALTIAACVAIVVVIAMMEVFRFKKARKVEENGIVLTGKGKEKHDKYVQKLEKDVNTLRNISSLTKRKNK